MIISGISLPENSIADQTVLKQAFSTSHSLVQQVQLCSIGLQTLNFINSQSGSYGFVSFTKIWDSYILYYPDERPVDDQMLLPEGYECRLLSVDDAFVINENWAYKTDISILTIEDLLRNSECSFGLVAKDTGNLIAWVMESENGAFGMLSCLDGHRRQGLAKYLVMRIAGKFREMHRPVFCGIVCDNEVSYKLHTSIGFREYREIFGWQSFERIG